MSRFPVQTSLVAALVFLSTAGCGEPPPVIPPDPAPAGIPPSPAQVRGVLRGRDLDAVKELFDWGESAFPAYEVILGDPKSTRDQVEGVLCMLAQVKADRSRFLGATVARLADPEWLVRVRAVTLLAEIGGEKDTPPVVALLSDEEESVCFVAAKTLAAIGGKRDLVAMDEWLRGGNHRDDARLIAHVKRCRDDLEVRLRTGVRPTPAPPDGGKPISD